VGEGKRNGVEWSSAMERRDRERVCVWKKMMKSASENMSDDGGAD
jgi:hypothetical protein